MPREVKICTCSTHAWVTTQTWGIVLVDVEDKYLIDNYNWTSKRDNRVFYAKSNTYARHNKTSNLLHRAILPEASKIDHKNHNGLDCRKHNLQSATARQNGLNRRPSKNSKLGLKGIIKTGNWYLVRLSTETGREKLGRFGHLADAICCYNLNAVYKNGNFAYLNPQMATYPHD